MSGHSQLIFGTDTVTAKFNLVDPTSIAVVSFDFSGMLEEDFWGEDFFKKNGINAFGFKVRGRNWWQTPDIWPAIAAVNACANGMELIGYGGSMGGYGAINFAEDLNLRSLIAFSSQYLVDPEKVPFEERWRWETNGLQYINDKISNSKPFDHGYMIYDPESQDAIHADLILQRHSLTSIMVNGGDHDEVGKLSRLDMLQPLVLDLIRGEFNMDPFQHELSARDRA